MLFLQWNYPLLISAHNPESLDVTIQILGREICDGGGSVWQCWDSMVLAGYQKESAMYRCATRWVIFYKMLPSSPSLRQSVSRCNFSIKPPSSLFPPTLTHQ